MTKQANKRWLWADWPVPKNVRAGTSIRTGGYSKKSYDDFNLAQHVGDDLNHVKKNREVLISHLGLQAEPIWLNQTHSSHIISIDNTPENLEADASFTSKKNKVCVIMTADCVPILLCNKNGTKIAAIHAGWKGICKGIIEETIKKFSDPETMLAWIGPCISKEHYEIGQDVYDAALSHSNLLENAFRQTRTNHWNADLPKIVRILLQKMGVGTINDCNLCTYEREDLFFSYRRDGNTGRIATMIWME